MDEVRTAYSNRAEEYSRLLGSIDSAHPSDLHLVTQWATAIDGPVIDVGCGPGQWTDHLAGHGCDVRGIDPTPAFIEHAHTAHPDCRFDVGTAENLDAASGSIAGILSWYSLIHHTPGSVHVPLKEFARALRPGGSLVIGFFESRVLEPFDHKVVTAYRWPVPELSARLVDVGFEVVETHTRTGVGYRPHGAIVAVRS